VKDHVSPTVHSEVVVQTDVLQEILTFKTRFDVLLTVHLSIILVNAQIFVL
jgi:hypothetical protein